MILLRSSLSFEGGLLHSVVSDFTAPRRTFGQAACRRSGHRQLNAFPVFWVLMTSWRGTSDWQKVGRPDPVRVHERLKMTQISKRPQVRRTSVGTAPPCPEFELTSLTRPPPLVRGLPGEESGAGKRELTGPYFFNAPICTW
jgi:hypothetical protein